MGELRASPAHPAGSTIDRRNRAVISGPIPTAGWTARHGNARDDREVRDLGAIPAHIKNVVGREAIAWHTAEWWSFQWEITELVTVTSARPQRDGWRDWLLCARACAEYRPDGPASSRPVIDILTADDGGLLTFALVTARKSRSSSGARLGRHFDEALDWSGGLYLNDPPLAPTFSSSDPLASRGR